MSSRFIVSLAASVIVSIVCIATISTEASHIEEPLELVASELTTVVSIAAASIVVQPYAVEWR